MNARHILASAALLGLYAGLAGCGEDNLQPFDPRFDTLTVFYGDPGPSASPCDDILPALDGVATSQEWSAAEPLFVRMSGANGNGGEDYYLEVRAIWTDEQRLGGTDRIYLMVRYPDNDFDAFPDQLAYIHRRQPGELCDRMVTLGGIEYCPSQVPRSRGIELPPGANCDSVVVLDPFWTRLNPDGREDQVLFLLTEASGSDQPTALIDANQDLLGKVGPETPAGSPITGGAAPTGSDLWIWRAGRTNLHPIPQFANWLAYDDLTGLPLLQISTFTQRTGFAEDLWIDPAGVLRDDAGLKPFVKNFGPVNPLTGVPHVFEGITLYTSPIYLTECLQPGKEPTDDVVAALNGGLAKDLALWLGGFKPNGSVFYAGATAMNECDSLACSRLGARPPKWSVRLLPGEYDKVPGWGLRIPDNPTSALHSGRDVRARGTYEVSQDKGFGVRSLELMRELDTGNPDDLVIRPGSGGEYRLVIGVLDASGRVGSGSTEIRLKFQSPRPRGGVVDRC